MENLKRIVGFRSYNRTNENGEVVTNYIIDCTSPYNENYGKGVEVSQIRTIANFIEGNVELGKNIETVAKVSRKGRPYLTYEIY